MSQKPMCVMDKHGVWCAAVGNPVETDASVGTVCGDYITLPHALKRRSPNCPACQDALAKESGETRE